MLCLEVYRNGQFLCRAGGPHMWHLLANISITKPEAPNPLSQRDGVPHLAVNGMNSPELSIHEFVWWAKKVPLNMGDEITVKLVDSEKYDSFEVASTYGTRNKESDEPEFFCSFCGRNAKETGGMHIGACANICPSCTTKSSEQLNEKKT
ncbi:MAG: hypothetical protein ACXU7Z_08110 [Burkholderiaceae bacterium]